MKPKKYSESKIETAQNFLSKYDLSFESLDESQKEILIGYTQARKNLMLIFCLLFFGLAVNSVGAYISYQTTDSGIKEIIKTIELNTESALFIYGKSCFWWGFTFSLYLFVALLMLVYISLIALSFKGRCKYLNAFLPALKQSFDNDKNPSN